MNTSQTVSQKVKAYNLVDKLGAIKAAEQLNLSVDQTMALKRGAEFYQANSINGQYYN